MDKRLGTEAQKSKTFRVATFYAQKLSGRSAETVSHDKPKKRTFASHDIAKECVMNVLAPLALPPTPVIWKIRIVLKLFGKYIGSHLEKSGQF